MRRCCSPRPPMCWAGVGADLDRRCERAANDRYRRVMVFAPATQTGSPLTWTPKKPDLNSANTRERSNRR
jgi:hypothetical protein